MPDCTQSQHQSPQHHQQKGTESVPRTIRHRGSRADSKDIGERLSLKGLKAMPQKEGREWQGGCTALRAGSVSTRKKSPWLESLAAKESSML